MNPTREEALFALVPTKRVAERTTFPNHEFYQFNRL
jgi:hypothetical protein